MQTPQVSTTARRARTETIKTIEPKVVKKSSPAKLKADVVNPANFTDKLTDKQPDVPADVTADPDAPLPPIIALIPDELLPECSFNDLQQQVRNRLSYTPSQLLSFWTLEQNEEEELTALHSLMEQEKSQDILVLLEAWQPPIEELFSWLALLRQRLGPDALIFLALIGKPRPETILTPVQPQHLQTWQLKTAALNDPGLQLIELVKP
jgi:hypothetical protein